jgi:hypothetical protein
LTACDVSSVFALHPIDATRTRLVTRVRMKPARTLVAVLTEPPSFLMTRKMLLGIKERAERPAACVPADGTCVARARHAASAFAAVGPEAS